MSAASCTECREVPVSWCGCWRRRVCAAHEDRCMECKGWGAEE